MNTLSNKKAIILLAVCGGMIFINMSKNKDYGNLQQFPKAKAAAIKEEKIAKAVFYLENSESTFGFVNDVNATEYVEVISELSEKPDFISENTNREFNFINGGNPLNLIPIGSNPATLKAKLNVSGFKCGNITKSNLNSMFQVALEKAQNDTISILITDAIYDIGKSKSPLNSLTTEGDATRSKFITRLETGNLQTLLIKLNSSFNGKYFFASKPGMININQSRPFYIFIFGKSELLNKYFSDQYITKSLKGINNYARFFVVRDSFIPYQLTTSINSIGGFRTPHDSPHKLIKVNPKSGMFQFSFATDLDLIPFTENYKVTIGNYECNNPKFQVVSVEKITDSQKHSVTEFPNPTHIITLKTTKNPECVLEVSLKNNIPAWITGTNAQDENNIDTDHTYGFDRLTNAITEAYTYKSKGNPLARFKIEISK